MANGGLPTFSQEIATICGRGTGAKAQSATLSVAYQQLVALWGKRSGTGAGNLYSLVIGCRYQLHA